MSTLTGSLTRETTQSETDMNMGAVPGFDDRQQTNSTHGGRVLTLKRPHQLTASEFTQTETDMNRRRLYTIGGPTKVST